MNKVSEIASKHLGKVGGEGYKDQYDPTLLVAIPRYLNREAYKIENSDLPFIGVDVWNAYEVSTLTKKGLPISGVMKIIIPANSEFHVESKSLKLYLNSFNMTKLEDSTEKTIETLVNRVERDLSDLMKCKTEVLFYTEKEYFGLLPFPSVGGSMKIESTPPTSLSTVISLDNVDFNKGFTGFDLFTGGKDLIYWRSDLLRSNCRVTNQPDWGDIFICMRGDKIPTPESLAKYIVSHRTVSHFHEEICEMVFTTLMQECNFTDLLVACLYTRRGGIDINPVRSTNQEWLPLPFTDLRTILPKTSRQ